MIARRAASKFGRWLKSLDRVEMNVRLAAWHGMSVEVFHAFRARKLIEVDEKTAYHIMRMSLLDELYVGLDGENVENVAMERLMEVANEHPYLWGYKIFLKNSGCESREPLRCFVNKVTLRTGLGYVELNGLREACEYVKSILRREIDCVETSLRTELQYVNV